MATDMEAEAKRLRGQVADGRKCPICGVTSEQIEEVEAKSPRMTAWECQNCQTFIQKNSTPEEVLAHIEPPQGPPYRHVVNTRGNQDYNKVVNDFWNNINNLKEENGIINTPSED